MDGLREDLAVCNAGYDAEREEKAAVEAARDEASKQLEFLEAELEGVRAEESALRADVKVRRRRSPRRRRTSRRRRRNSPTSPPLETNSTTRCDDSRN